MKKLLLSILCIILFQSYGFAISYEDLNTIKEPAYRFGTTDEVENPMDVNTTLEKKAVMSDSSVEDANLTYADLSIKRISKEISQDLQIDYDEILSDLSMLWQGAATKSDTIKFALYKLANPNEDKPDKNSIKKVLSAIANMSTLVGAGTGNPLLASASLIGGNTLGILSQDTKALNYKYTKVGDADMIILVRKIDELQQKVVGIYYDYMTARELYNMRSEMANRRHYYYTQTQNGSKEMILIADAYYREALDLQKKAKNRFADKRAQLEQIVGPDTFKQFEEMINARDKK